MNLDDQAIPLEEWLGDLPDRFSNHDLGSWRVQAEQAYEIDADWKLIAEDFMEYYHLPWVHPELIKVSRMEDHHRYRKCRTISDRIDSVRKVGARTCLFPGGTGERRRAMGGVVSRPTSHASRIPSGVAERHLSPRTRGLPPFEGLTGDEPCGWGEPRSS